jgi:hypothetical protein
MYQLGEGRTLGTAMELQITNKLNKGKSAEIEKFLIKYNKYNDRLTAELNK